MKQNKFLALVLTLSMLLSLVCVVPTSAAVVADSNLVFDLNIENYNGTSTSSITDAKGNGTITLDSNAPGVGTYINQYGEVKKYLTFAKYDPDATKVYEDSPKRVLATLNSNVAQQDELTIEVWAKYPCFIPLKEKCDRMFALGGTAEKQQYFDVMMHTTAFHYRAGLTSAPAQINKIYYEKDLTAGGAKDYKDNWAHYVFTRKWTKDGDNDVLTSSIYLNGCVVRDNVVVEGADKSQETGTNLYIGNNTGLQGFLGQISSFKVYDVAFEQENAIANYNSQKKTYSELKAVVDLDFTGFNGNVNSVVDVSGAATISTLNKNAFERGVYTNLNGNAVPYLKNDNKNALVLDGSAFKNLPEQTISVWAKIPSNAGSSRLLNYTASSTDGAFFDAFLYPNKTLTLSVRPARTASGFIQGNQPWDQIHDKGQTDTWVHFLFVKKWDEDVAIGETGTLTYDTYVNGLRVTDGGNSGTNDSAVRSDEAGAKWYLAGGTELNGQLSNADISYFKIYDNAFTAKDVLREYESTYRDYMEKETLLDLGFTGEVGSAATLIDKAGHEGITFTTASNKSMENPVKVASFSSATGETKYLEFGELNTVVDEVYGGGVKIAGVNSGNLPEVTYEFWVRIPEYVSRRPGGRFFTLNSVNNSSTEGDLFDSYMHGGANFGFRPAISKIKNGNKVYSTGYGAFVNEQAWYKGQDLADQWVHFVYTKKWSNVEKFDSSSCGADSDGYLPIKDITDGARGNLEIAWYKNGELIPTSTQADNCYLQGYTQGNPGTYTNVYRRNEANSIIGLLMAPNASSANLHAQIGAFRVYNSALSKEDVDKLFASQALSYKDKISSFELVTPDSITVSPTAGEIELEFSNYIDGDSIDGNIELLKDGVPVKGGSFAYAKSANDMKVYIKHGALVGGSRYVIKIKSGVKSINGITLADDVYVDVTTNSTEYVNIDFNSSDYTENEAPALGKGLIYNSYNNETDQYEAGNTSAFVIKKDATTGKKFLQVKGGYDGGSKNTFLDVDSNFLPRINDGVLVADVSIRTQYGTDIGEFNTDANVMSYNDAYYYISCLRFSTTLRSHFFKDIQSESRDVESFAEASRNANGFFDARYIYQKNADGKYTATLYNLNDSSYVPFTSTPKGDVTAVKNIRVLHMYPINQAAYENDRAEIASIRIYKASEAFVLSSEGYDAANNSVSVTFSDDIKTESVVPANISVAKVSNNASATVASAEYNEATRTAVITFADKLAPNQDYEISFDGVVTVSGIAPGDFTFNAESAEVGVDGDTVFKNQNGVELKNTAGATKVISNFVFKNWTDAPVDCKFVMVAYEIVDGVPTIVKAIDIYDEDVTLDAGKDIEVGLAVDGLDAAKTYEIKVLIWDAFTNGEPHVNPLVLSAQ